MPLHTPRLMPSSVNGLFMTVFLNYIYRPKHYYADRPRHLKYTYNKQQSVLRLNSLYEDCREDEHEYERGEASPGVSGWSKLPALLHLDGRPANTFTSENNTAG